jgi:hypothetical protein
MEKSDRRRVRHGERTNHPGGGSQIRRADTVLTTSNISFAHRLALQPDGKILISGSFDNVDGCNPGSLCD